MLHINLKHCTKEKKENNGNCLKQKMEYKLIFVVAFGSIGFISGKFPVELIVQWLSFLLRVLNLLRKICFIV